MNLPQVQSVQAQISQFENLDFDLLISANYPDRKDLENIELSQMNLAEFIYLSKRVFSQFGNAFHDRENTLVFQMYYSHPVSGAANLDAQIQAYVSAVLSNNISIAENYLLWLIAYQIEFGFYNTPEKITKETLNLPILIKLGEKLNFLETNIANSQKDAANLITELQTNKQEIQNLIIQKRDELTQITTNLTTSNSQANQISELLTRGTEQSSRSTTLLEQQENNKLQTEKKLLELEELYADTNNKLINGVKTITSQIVEFKTQVKENEEHLKFVEGKKEFFEERIKYLEDLIGREVGASLFETFNQRKKELNAPVLFWRNAVPFMAIGTIIWILILFNNQSLITDINLWWQAFAINTIKTIPAIFILLFSINQYRKERNFQEEYAFKSAVALTIDAYANRISDLSSKDNLIMEAVLGVYKTPIEEKQTSRRNNKTTTDMMKTMLETTRDLVSKK
jgi:hypothetical protein